MSRFGRSRPAAARTEFRGWVADLRTAAWTEPSVFTIHGWSFVSSDEFTELPADRRVFLQEVGTGKIHEARVRASDTTEPNAVARKASVDRTYSAFDASFDFESVLAASSSEAESWVVHISYSVGGRACRGRFQRVASGGSATALRTSFIGAHTAIAPRWDGEQGLVFNRVRTAAIVSSVESGADQVTITATCSQELAPVAARLVGYGAEIDATITSVAACVFRVLIPYRATEDRGGSPRTWKVQLGDSAGSTIALHWSPQVEATVVEGAPSTPAIGRNLQGECVLDTAPAPLTIEAVDMVSPAEGPPILRVQAVWTGEPDASLQIGLVGPRQSSWSQRTPADGDRITLDVPFGVPLAPFGAAPSGQLLVLPRGRYELVAAGSPEAPTPSYALAEGLADSLYRRIHDDWFNVRIERTGTGGLSVLLAPPLEDDEVGRYHDRQLNQWDRERTPEPEPAAYFESFFGKSAACNPLALHDEYARRHPNHIRYWGVKDYSVPVPAGVIPVITGSREWRRARSDSRYLFVNDWLRKFDKKAHQTVVQTWHGTPYKRLALDRLGRRENERFVAAVARQVAHWDYLITQNAFMTEVMRSAYDPPSQVLELGYPRNDSLSTSLSAAEMQTLRTRLGISADRRVILFAPTRREAKATLVRLLDLEQLVGAVGDEYVVLLRGHMNTLGASKNVEIPGVIDVTSYPEVTDLFSVADVMITDYSSVMFDFSNTGKPMLFFVPDLDAYVNEQRGVYFDLPPLAPGPLLTTTDEVIKTLHDLGECRTAYASAYAAWTARFTPHDDGTAAARVLDAVMASTDP